MSDLRLAMVQQTASLDAAQNRELLDPVLQGLEPDTGLVVLPEAFMRDFGPADDDLGVHAERLDGPFVTRLRELAAQHRTVLVAGMFEVSDDPARPFNTVVVVGPDGLRTSYRKIHLYDSFGYRESSRLTAGPVEPVIIEVAGVTLGLMTCYDLRFPELARELVRCGAQLLVVPSAWVAGPGKVSHWRTLTVARAIENTVFVASVGQPGPRYTGHSLLVGPAGDVLAEVGDGDHVVTASVSIEVLDQVRGDNPSLLNRRF